MNKKTLLIIICFVIVVMIVIFIQGHSFYNKEEEKENVNKISENIYYNESKDVSVYEQKEVYEENGDTTFNPEIE